MVVSVQRIDRPRLKCRIPLCRSQGSSSGWRTGRTDCDLDLRERIRRKESNILLSACEGTVFSGRASAWGSP